MFFWMIGVGFVDVVFLCCCSWCLWWSWFFIGCWGRMFYLFCWYWSWLLGYSLGLGYVWWVLGSCFVVSCLWVWLCWFLFGYLCIMNVYWCVGIVWVVVYGIVCYRWWLWLWVFGGFFFDCLVICMELGVFWWLCFWWIWSGLVCCLWWLGCILWCCIVCVVVCCWLVCLVICCGYGLCGIVGLVWMV